MPRQFNPQSGGLELAPKHPGDLSKHVCKIIARACATMNSSNAIRSAEGEPAVSSGFLQDAGSPSGGPGGLEKRPLPNKCMKSPDSIRCKPKVPNNASDQSIAQLLPMEQWSSDPMESFAEV